MNEQENEVLVEETSDQEDHFAEGFDEGESRDEANQAADGENAEEEPERDQEPDVPDDGADTAAQETGLTGVQEAQEQETEQETEQERADGERPGPTWEVNHLGQRRTMEAKDVTPELLQKGLDYDRVRTQYDKQKPAMELIATLAGQAGLSPEEYIRTVRLSAKQAEGLSQQDAKRAVELEDREARVAAAEAADRGQREARQAEEEQVRQGLEEFAKAFPEAYDRARTDPGAIPESVWADVRAGLSLTAAYARYCVSQADQAAQAARHTAQDHQLQQKNAQRSTGSMRSAGGDVKNKDAFLAGFDE